MLLPLGRRTYTGGNVRRNIKTVEIFAHLWNCSVNDLLVSFDGFLI